MEHTPSVMRQTIKPIKPNKQIIVSKNHGWPMLGEGCFPHSTANWTNQLLPLTSVAPRATIWLSGVGVGQSYGRDLSVTRDFNRIRKLGLCTFGYRTLSLTGCRLPLVFSRKHRANLSGGFTPLYKAVLLSVVVCANMHEHILKPCSSRNKTQKTAACV